ncbi:MAG: BatA and WFA domain-containing protein [Clostridia bacterium]|nr:BatA and WFA domain-containing protein [Clostridia bacterium]
MSFMYPLCLLALLGVPVVILIYILKRHYTEQTVNSTYIWTLSEKFLKRRNPLSGLTGIISLILQILMIVLITFALIHPIIKLNDQAERYCFVVDASASMNMETDGETRLDRGKKEIEKIISSSTKGSEYSLVYVSDEATTAFERVTSKENALELLDEVKPSYSGSNYIDASSVAQELFNQTPSINVYLITDKTFVHRQNVTIINVAKDEGNVGMTSLEVLLEDGIIKVKGILNSYKKQSTVNVDIYVDEVESPVASTTVVTPPLKEMPAGMDTPFEVPPIPFEKETYTSVRAVIREADSLLEDNEYIVYNKESNKQSSIIIISETPFFLEAAIHSIGDYSITAVSPEEYEAKYKDSAFGLYIFDSYTPDTTPNNGAVWMLNASESAKNSGFSYRSKVLLKEPANLERSTDSSTLARKLLNGVDLTDTYLIEYLRYSTYTSYTTLFSVAGTPLVMAGENAYGNRSVVFAFDLHNSNIPMSGDYVTLIDNLLAYSFPSVLEKTGYFVGDMVTVNTVANCESVKVVSPLGDTKYLDTAQTLNEVYLNQIGTYTVNVTVGGVSSEYKLFSEAQLTERTPISVEQNFSIYGTPSNDRIDGEYDPMIIIFILLIVIFAADWMVYMYEKRQLR